MKLRTLITAIVPTLLITAALWAGPHYDEPASGSDLPLSGGTVTGDITLDSASIDMTTDVGLAYMVGPDPGTTGIGWQTANTYQNRVNGAARLRIDTSEVLINHPVDIRFDVTFNNNETVLSVAANGQLSISDNDQVNSVTLDVSTGDLTLDDDSGLIGSTETADPCGGMGEGSIFYNDTSNYYCYCDGTSDVQLHDPATACF